MVVTGIVMMMEFQTLIDRLISSGAGKSTLLKYLFQTLIDRLISYESYF